MTRGTSCARHSGLLHVVPLALAKVPESKVLGHIMRKPKGSDFKRCHLRAPAQIPLTCVASTSGRSNLAASITHLLFLQVSWAPLCFPTFAWSADSAAGR